MTQDQTIRALSSAAMAGFLVAAAAAVIYFMRLSIFDRTTVEWVFVFGLAALVVAIFCAFLSSIWGTTR